MRILVPLLAGIGVIACTIVHGAALAANLAFVRHERALGRYGTGFWIDLGLVSVTLTLALTAHLLEIGLWAAVFVGFGEFAAWGTALITRR